MISVFIIASLGLVSSARISVEPEYLNSLRVSGNDEEFARLLGLADVSLVRPSNEERSEHVRWKSVSPLGDILLTKEQSEQDRQGLRFDKYPASKWSNREIPYVIQKSDFSTKQVKDIEAWIVDFNSLVDNVKIVKRRVRFPQRDYVVVFSGNGCYSYLGRIGGGQPLSLQSNGCVSSGTVHHEFMHAAGFTHEHNRPDRDEYIKVLTENIPPEWQSQYEKVSEEDFGIQGPYDYYSIMHYPVKAPGGKPAFKVLKEGIDESYIGQDNGLTKIDIDKLNVLYS